MSGLCTEILSFVWPCLVFFEKFYTDFTSFSLKHYSSLIFSINKLLIRQTKECISF
jgi:hypothetical protein